MEKQNSTNPAYNYSVPTSGVGTSTSSGVTVLDSASMNTNAPLPPSYDQAMGNSPTFNTTARTYTTTRGWNVPGMGAPNTTYNIPATHTTTTYATYGTSTPLPQPPRNPPNQTPFGQPPVVIIQQQPLQALGPEPIFLTCPACHVQKLTRIEYEPSSRTHLMAALLCLVGLWCCVCLPYCAGSCMNTHHYCGNCDKFLGTYGNAL